MGCDMYEIAAAMLGCEVNDLHGLPEIYAPLVVRLNDWEQLMKRAGRKEGPVSRQVVAVIMEQWRRDITESGEPAKKEGAR